MARPREFDPQEALGAIMGVFWRNGFEGTSMQDIEAATGLNKQSLYRLYADKRAMYLAALRRYDETEVARAGGILAEPGAPRERFRRLFTDVLAETRQDGPRRGCFLCNASAEEALLDDDARAFVTGAMGRVERAFRDALAAGAPYADDAVLRKATAAKLLAFYFGLRVLVKANVPAATLKAAVRRTLEEIEAA